MFTQLNSENLAALHDSRKAYIRAESSTKTNLKLTLQKKTSNTPENFQLGQEVYIS